MEKIKTSEVLDFLGYYRRTECLDKGIYKVYFKRGMILQWHDMIQFGTCFRPTGKPAPEKYEFIYFSIPPHGPETKIIRWIKEEFRLSYEEINKNLQKGKIKLLI